MKDKRSLFSIMMPAAFLVTALVAVNMSMPGLAKKPRSKPVDAEAVFKQNCASCHPAGGNSVNSKKPVVGSKTLVTLATFKQYLESPTGHMPYYQHLLKDRDLLQALYKYCKKIKTVPTGA